ncbi:MAG: choice-of-anchor L domain-containing protein [Myxococcales bacterium]|nr:choice-of-anchor L domain-containing protein [Myxococcales bacterium]
MCGDLVIDPGEECDDGNDIPGDGCEPDCTLTPPPNDCGNGQIDDGEQCDGDMLPITDCTEFNDSFSGGTLSCAINCSYDTSGCEKCEAPGQHTPCDSQDDDLLHAIELNCQTLGGDWADTNKHVPVTNYALMSPDNTAYRVIKQFGTYTDPNDNNLPLWRPKAGEKMLIIGSGKFPAPNGQGVLTQAGGTISSSNGNPDNQNKLPGVMSHLKGSNNGGGGTPFMNCDLVNDCSDTLYDQWTKGSGANDVLHFSFDLKVPKGTYGYVVDFAYFSSEYPSWVNTSFNDMALIWSTSETYTGNASFITDNNNNPRPLSVTALAQNGLIKYSGNAAQLVNTGFTGNGATGWATVKGSAAPEEEFNLSFAVMDLSDTILDTVLIIDNWRWDCVGCVPSEIDSCGVLPQ